MMRSSPHTHSSNNVASMMRQVIYACVPGIAMLIYFFGWGVFINVCLSTGLAVAAEAACLHLRNRPIKPILLDYSAVLTGVLVGLSIPPLTPWWITAIGVIFAIVFAKQLYGGLGYNPFNPAMVAYVLLLISFPMQMTAWLPAWDLAQTSPTLWESLKYIFVADSDGPHFEMLRLGADGFTMATPLDYWKTQTGQEFLWSEISSHPTLDGVLAGHAWEWVNIAFLIGGIFLFARKIIGWQIPAGMLGAMTVTALALRLIDDSQFAPVSFHLLSGATMIGAFFIATDPISASTTPKGRIIFGAGIGFLVVIIRSFGGYPDGVAFAVLLMNMAVPLIDYYTQPRVYGHRSTHEHDRELLP